VINQTPFSVEECSVGTGAACGSVYLDQGFENLLRKKFGQHAKTILDGKRVTALVRHFDSTIKREYNPFDPDCDNEFEIPLAGVTDIPELGIEDGYLRLQAYIF
jgi:hypothetical protein